MCESVEVTQAVPLYCHQPLIQLECFLRTRIIESDMRVHYDMISPQDNTTLVVKAKCHISHIDQIVCKHSTEKRRRQQIRGIYLKKTVDSGGRIRFARGAIIALSVPDLTWGVSDSSINNTNNWPVNSGR